MALPLCDHTHKAKWFVKTLCMEEYNEPFLSVLNIRALGHKNKLTLEALFLFICLSRIFECDRDTTFLLNKNINKWLHVTNYYLYAIYNEIHRNTRWRYIFWGATVVIADNNSRLQRDKLFQMSSWWRKACSYVLENLMKIRFARRAQRVAI